MRSRHKSLRSASNQPGESLKGQGNENSKPDEITDKVLCNVANNVILAWFRLDGIVLFLFFSPSKYSISQASVELSAGMGTASFSIWENLERYRGFDVLGLSGMPDPVEVPPNIYSFRPSGPLISCRSPPPGASCS